MEQLLMEWNHKPRLSQVIEVWWTHPHLRLSLCTCYSACVHLSCLPLAFLGTLITYQFLFAPMEQQIGKSGQPQSEWTPMSEWDPLLCGWGGIGQSQGAALPWA